LELLPRIPGSVHHACGPELRLPAFRYPLRPAHRMRVGELRDRIGRIRSAVRDYAETVSGQCQTPLRAEEFERQVVGSSGRGFAMRPARDEARILEDRVLRVGSLAVVEQAESTAGTGHRGRTIDCQASVDNIERMRAE